MNSLSEAEMYLAGEATAKEVEQVVGEFAGVDACAVRAREWIDINWHRTWRVAFRMDGGGSGGLPKQLQIRMRNGRSVGRTFRFVQRDYAHSRLP